MLFGASRGWPVPLQEVSRSKGKQKFVKIILSYGGDGWEWMRMGKMCSYTPQMYGCIKEGRGGVETTVKQETTAVKTVTDVGRGDI